MSDVKISQFPYIGNTGYTPTDLLVFVNYLNPTGTTSNTKIDNVKDYVILDSYNYFLPLSGGTVTGSTTFTNGLTTNTISATTYQNLPDNATGKYLPLSGGTVTGSTLFQNGITANTISATTYQNLPDNVTGKYLPLSGGTVTGSTTFTNGLTTNTISATTYQNLPIDPDTFVTGFTYNDNVFTIKQNNGQPNLTSTINTVTGLTVNGVLTATTFSANTVVISGITVNPKQTIALFFGHDSLSPGDNQTYYIGNAINLTAPISGSDGRRVIIPKTGNIVRVDICQNVGGSVATGLTEYSVFTINNVTQSTQSTITTTYLYNTSNGNIAYDLGTPLSVNVGDKIEIRWTTPSWGVNPTAIRQQMNVYLEY